MRRFSPFFLLGLAGLLWVGCRPDSAAPSTVAPAPPDKPAESITNYTVRGVVQALRADGKTVVVKHEEIPGYMMAMTMPLEARPTNELAGLMVWDQIEFRMRVTADDGWIDQIRILGTAKPEATNVVGDIRVLPNVPELKPGDPVPNYSFTNQLGQVVHLADFRGQALAFTFIFTRCPFPTFCPRMSEHFGKAMRQLKADTNGPANWHLLSLSFDPDFDTPTTLAAYGKRYAHDPARWSLATGSFNQIERIAGHFQLYFSRNVPAAQLNHNLRTVVLDPAGRVHEVFVGNEWTVEELVRAVQAAAKVK